MTEQDSENNSVHRKKFDWTIFRRPAVISTFLLVALWNISVSSNLLTRALEGQGTLRETARAIRDINLNLQLRFYHILTRRRPIPFQPDHVSLASINDDTHWTALYGNQPTSRAYLARLVTNASQTRTKAAAIGLDFELLAPRGFPEGTDAQTRFNDNQALLSAVKFATSQGVPVILGGVYYVDEKNRYLDLPKIYTVQDLLVPENLDCSRVRCPAFGYLNIPDDKRQIPLAKSMISFDKSKPEVVDSFALAVAKAVKGPQALSRYPVLSDKTPRSESILGTFLPEDQIGRAHV